MKRNETHLQTHLELGIDSFYCAAQILVIDHPNGAAAILVDTMKRIAEQEWHVVQVDDQTEATICFESNDYDLIIIGLSKDRPDNIALVPYFKEQREATPIFVIGDGIHHRTRDRAYDFGADEVLGLPHRAKGIKELLHKVSTQYLLF